jgi:hypothetical protein
MYDDQDFTTLWKDADPDIPILKQGGVREAAIALFSDGCSLICRHLRTELRIFFYGYEGVSIPL